MSLLLMAGGATVSPVMSTAEAAAPRVTLNAPASPSHNATPSFAGTASYTTPVTVHIFAGALAKGTVVSTATATGTGATWASGSASPALASGQYTAVATQENSIVGDAPGKSGPVTFMVTPPLVVPPTEPLVPAPAAVPPSTLAAVPPPTPPLASFRWFPPVPQTGEPVSLVSISTDATSPITGIAWALTSSGPFQGGGAVLTTSFSTPGAHVVRLRVIDAYDLASVATETIKVIGRAPSLMQPFPVVRIAGTETAFGVKLGMLRVQQMPAGAKITVRCKGRGCPIKVARRVAMSSKRGAATVEFRGFERSLHFGVTLEVLVSKPDEIGKYTRFAIRRGTPPERVDMCLDVAGVKPMVCPLSAA
ncbi:MAG TPA: hypothetical protein VNY31_07740 [Solirubrobacteraceae bacterium]|jgi:hypothetical protein|nr:hypothetical protein [Solirubrobacteraceae bacterium]